MTFIHTHTSRTKNKIENCLSFRISSNSTTTSLLQFNNNFTEMVGYSHRTFSTKRNIKIQTLCIQTSFSINDLGKCQVIVQFPWWNERLVKIYMIGKNRPPDMFWSSPDLNRKSGIKRLLKSLTDFRVLIHHHLPHKWTTDTLWWIVRSHRSPV